MRCGQSLAAPACCNLGSTGTAAVPHLACPAAHRHHAHGSPRLLERRQRLAAQLKLARLLVVADEFQGHATALWRAHGPAALLWRGGGAAATEPARHGSSFRLPSAQRRPGKREGVPRVIRRLGTCSGSGGAGVGSSGPHHEVIEPLSRTPRCVMERAQAAAPTAAAAAAAACSGREGGERSNTRKRRRDVRRVARGRELRAAMRCRHAAAAGGGAQDHPGFAVHLADQFSACLASMQGLTLFQQQAPGRSLALARPARCHLSPGPPRGAEGAGRQRGRASKVSGGGRGMVPRPPPPRLHARTRGSCRAQLRPAGSLLPAAQATPCQPSQHGRTLCGRGARFP